MLNFNVVNIANDGKEIYLWHRIGKTLSLFKDKTFFPYFYQLSPTGIFKTIDNKKVNKVICSRPSDVKNRRDENSYEADILFTKRYIIDKIFAFGKADLKYSFIDIEVITKELPSYLNPIHAISCISCSNSYTNEIETFYLRDYASFIDEEGIDSETEVEKELLNTFVKWIKEQQFDLLLGWNFIDFDWRYLSARYKKLFGCELADMLSPIAQSRYLGSSKEETIPNLIPAGLSVCDYLDFYKKIYRTESSYALDIIAQKRLNEQSFKKVDFSRLSEEIKEKNINDVRRMIEIEKKLKIIEYYDELRRMSMCEWSDVTWNCLDEESEILTNQGWKKYNEIIKEQKVYSLNPINNKLELIPINGIFIYDYTGKMIDYNNERVNFLTTSNHRFLMREKNKFKNILGYKFFNADKIPSGDRAFFITGSDGYNGSFNNLNDNQIKLMAWIITEGNFETNTNAISIYQNEGKKAKEIENLFKENNLNLTLYRQKTRRNNIILTFRITPCQATAYRILLKSKKEIPEWAYELSIEQKRLFVEELMKGDGSWQYTKNSGYYCSANKNLVEQFQRLSILAGWNCFLKEQKTICNKKECITYYACIYKNQYSTYRPKGKKEINYTGKIWCIANDYENFIMRRKGKIIISGNSKMIDMILLREAKQKGIVLPSKHYGEGIEIEETFEGAYRRCDTGLYKNLWKLDLSSAYPQAIINFCLDIANIKNEGIEINKIKFYQNENALLPTIARKLINRKDILKSQLKSTNPETEEYQDLQIKYDAIKAVVNSLFGVCGLKVFRLFDYRIASSITFLIRDLLHYVEEKLKEKEMNVTYIDTDSVFIEAKENPKDLCNDLVKQWAKEKYNKDKIDIEFDLEGQFEKLFVVALCHYKGYLRTKSGLKEEIKGIESKRKDSSNFIREFQTNLIEKIMNEESQEKIIEFINNEKERIKTLSLIDIGFPCRINAEKDYKSIPIFMRALEYTKEINSTFNKVAGDSFYWIPVIPFGKAIRKSSRNMTNKETGEKELQTSEKDIDKNVICFDENNLDYIKKDAFDLDKNIDQKVLLDWKRIIDKSILDKTENIFEALKWDVSKIKEVKEKKIRVKKETIVSDKGADNNAGNKTIQATELAQSIKESKKESLAVDNSLQSSIKEEIKCLLTTNVLSKEDIIKVVTMRKNKTYLDRLMKNKEFQEKFDQEYQNLCEETLVINKEFKVLNAITERTIQSAEAFGLGIDAETEFVIYRNCELKYNQGDVIYVTGDSGSGKSWILKNIFAKLKNSICIDDVKVDDEEVIIEGVGKNISDALAKLNIAGLGDAFLYLRKYNQLSDGQKYRYKIAKFIDNEDKDVWILDEFCATLDRVTAKVISYNLQKIARKLGKTVVCATTHNDLLEELRPDTYILKGYESDVEIKYFNKDNWKNKKLEFYNDMKVEIGAIEDYEKLKRFHYRQANLGARKAIYKITYKNDLIGVIVICYPHLALKGRNIALNNELAKMTKENCKKLNDEFDSIARIIIHPKFRGIGLAQYFLQEYFKLTSAKYVETLATMALYNPFFEKAGMTRVDVAEDETRAKMCKELENLGFDIKLLSSARYCQNIYEKLSDTDKEKTILIITKILNKYKGQISKLFSKDKSIKEIVKDDLFRLMKEIRRSTTVYLIWERK